MALRHSLLLGAALCAACGDGPKSSAMDMAVKQESFRYVTSSVTLPADQTEYTYDALGDNMKRNRLGSIVGALTFSGVKVQESENEAVAHGDGLNLLQVSAGDPDLIADPGASVDFWAAEKMLPPEDGGVGMWTIDDAVAKARFSGALAAGRFQSVDPRPLKDPPTFSFKINLKGADPVLIPVYGARLAFTASRDGLMAGQLNGGMKKTDIDTLLIPAVAKLMTDGLHKMPCDEKCVTDNDNISKRFDTGGCGAAVAGDLVIDICEVSENGLVKNLIAAEVQLFDAGGAWAPNKANTAPDALTMGVAFTATRADFVP